LSSRVQMALEQAAIVVDGLPGDLAIGDLQERGYWDRCWFAAPGAVIVGSLEGCGLPVSGEEGRVEDQAKGLSTERRGKLALQLTDLCVDLDREVDVVGIL